MAEAKRFEKQRCDGRMLKPSDLMRELHHDLVEARQAKLTSEQEMEKIETELKLLMATASEIEGVAVWRSTTSPSLDTARLKKERRDIYDAFYTPVTQLRQFKPRW